MGGREQKKGEGRRSREGERLGIVEGERERERAPSIIKCDECTTTC